MGNKELQAKLTEFIQRNMKQHAGHAGDAEGLSSMGDVKGALEMLAGRGEWAQCLALGEKQSGEVLNHYLLRCVKVQMEAGKFGEAAGVLSKYGMHPVTQNYPIYKTLALEIFIDCDVKEVVSLRTGLFSLIRGLEQTGDVNTPAGREFGKYLMVAHLINLKNTYQEKGIGLL